MRAGHGCMFRLGKVGTGTENRALQRVLHAIQAPAASTLATLWEWGRASAPWHDAKGSSCYKVPPLIPVHWSGPTEAGQSQENAALPIRQCRGCGGGGREAHFVHCGPWRHACNHIALAIHEQGEGLAQPTSVGRNEPALGSAASPIQVCLSEGMGPGCKLRYAVLCMY